MKVCIILPKGLPVPSILGGAIETLVTDIVNINETENKLDLTVVSTYANGVIDVSSKYNNTKFIYINPKSIKYILKAIKVRMLKLFKKELNTYNECVLDKIKHSNYDYILVEDGAFHSFKSYLKYFKKEQMILHFHHVGDAYADKVDSVFSKFIAVSNFVLTEFKKTSKIDKCYVLKNGIDISKFDKPFEDIRGRYGFSDNDFIVTFCGRLIKEKGVIELIDAINSIDNPNIKLLLIGSGSGAYMDLIKEKLTDKITLAGFISNSEVCNYYRSSNVGVIPSTCEDAAPLVTIEMMISGLPLVITKSGGAFEYVSDSTIIIPKDDNLVNNIKTSILKLYNDKNLLESMKVDGINTSKSFTTYNFYYNLIDILRK